MKKIAEALGSDAPATGSGGEPAPSRTRATPRSAPAAGKAPLKRTAKGRRARGKAIRVMVRWSREREDRFLESLAATPNIAEALRVSGLSDRSLRRRRDASPDFHDKWIAALRVGYAKLEVATLKRALDGVEMAVWYGGKQVGTRRQYNDRVAVTLLRMHRETASGSKPLAAADETADAARARLATHLSEMNKRMGGAG